MRKLYCLGILLAFFLSIPSMVFAEGETILGPEKGYVAGIGDVIISEHSVPVDVRTSSRGLFPLCFTFTFNIQEEGKKDVMLNRQFWGTGASFIGDGFLSTTYHAKTKAVEEVEQFNRTNCQKKESIKGGPVITGMYLGSSSVIVFECNVVFENPAEDWMILKVDLGRIAARMSEQDTTAKKDYLDLFSILKQVAPLCSGIAVGDKVYVSGFFGAYIHDSGIIRRIPHLYVFEGMVTMIVGDDFIVVGRGEPGLSGGVIFKADGTMCGVLSLLSEGGNFVRAAAVEPISQEAKKLKSKEGK